MSTATKLEYLNTTKEKIRDSINLTGANIGTSDTFRSYATKLKLGLIDIINNGTDTLYSNFPKVSGIGSNLSLTPTYEAPMKLNEIQGDTFQQTYTGKNKFNLTQNNTTYNNVTTQYKGSEFILNGTTSGSANIISLDSSNLYSVGTLKAGTYAFTLITNSGYNANNHSSAFYLRKSDFTSVKGHGISENDNFTGTFTLEEDSELFVQIYSNSGNIVFNDFHMYFQIELGSTATDYEPYVGGTASPNPDYPQTIQNVTGLQNIEVCGKNLFDGGNTSEVQNVMFTKNEDGSYDISGIASAQANLYNYVDIEKSGLINNEKYTVSVNQTLPQQVFILIEGYNGSTWVRLLLNQLDNTTSKQTAIINISGCTRVRYGIRISNGTNVNISNLKIQLEKGSTATSYEEYKRQSYEINLGKNLFDKNNANILQGCFINGSNNKIEYNGSNNCLYIPCDFETTYTVSKVKSDRFAVATTNTVPNNNVSTLQTVQNNDATSLTITTNSNAKYLVVHYYRTSDTLTPQEIIDTLQIEKGTKATSYSPYFTPIELCKIGTYQDYIYKNNGNWYLHQEIGKVVLDGSESWTQRNTGDGSTTITFNLNLSNIGAYGSENVYCDKFTYEQTSTSGNEGIGISSDLIGNYIQIKRNRLSSLNVAGFKSWLSSNNVELYYILATPTNTLITNTELIEDLETLYTAKSQEGTTNISITSEDLEMILNISALRGEV